MAVDKLINETQGNDIIDRLDDIASNLENVAAIIPAKFGMGLATCDTAADTAAKTCTIPNFALTNGAPVSVKFTYSNSASNATLNINGTGAKPMYYKGNPLGSSVISAGDIATFVYSSTGVYHIINIDTLTGAGTGTVTQIGGTGGITTNQTSGAPIQHDGNVKLNLKSDTAYTGTVADPSTDASIANGNVYPVALDGNGHPVVGVPWTDTTYSDFGASGSSHGHGLVPDPGETAGTSRFLCENGNWAEPSSSSSGSSSLSDLDTTKTTNKPNRWTTVYFDGFSFSADQVWSDGTNTYYSSGSYQKILDKINQVWTNKTWSGLTNYYGNYVWTDGTDIFYSTGTSHYVLNKSTSTWSSKSWSGLTDFDGDKIWTDGTTTYYSDGTTQYYLDKSSSNIWRSTSWNIYVASPEYIWSDGKNIYYSNGSSQYILNKSTGNWDEKVWTGLTSFTGNAIWTDGEDIYHSSTTQNVLDIANSKWYVKQWLGSYQPSGMYIWSDGLNTYHSSGNNKYVLVKPVKSTKVPYTMSNEELTSAVQNKVSVRVENGTLIFS